MRGRIAQAPWSVIVGSSAERHCPRPRTAGKSRQWPLTRGAARRDAPAPVPGRPASRCRYARCISTYRDEAIVLRRLDYGEADRILTLLTKEHGKVGAIAKGVRRPQSRLDPVLQTFGHLDLQLAVGHNLDVVTQAVRLPGPRLPGDLEWTSRASLIAEVADRVAEERHPVPDVFELTREGLTEVATATMPRRATARFLMDALERFGYAPRLHECASCDRPLPEAPAAFAPEAGGFLCPSCAVPQLPTVSVAAVKVLRVLAAGDLDLYRRLRLDDELLSALEDVLEAQLEHHLDRQLRSLRFLRRARHEGRSTASLATPPAAGTE